MTKCKHNLNLKVNNVLQQFYDWCFSNHLIININKTVCIEFTGAYKNPTESLAFNLNNTALEISNSTKFLGTHIDRQMCWKAQVDHVCSKLNKSFFALVTLKNTLTEESLLNVYYANVYSVLSYNIISWGRTTEIERVFIIQKRIIRLMFGLTYGESCRQAFRNKQILTVTSIYLLKLLCYIHSQKHNLATVGDVHTYPTRNRNNIAISSFKHSYFKKSPLYSGCTYYNILPADIKCSNTPMSFKKKIKKLLTDNCFYNLSEFETFLKNE